MYVAACGTSGLVALCLRAIPLAEGGRGEAAHRDQPRLLHHHHLVGANEIREQNRLEGNYGGGGGGVYRCMRVGVRV